ncbi:SRPBCC family protein [Nocardioides anomalus]|uniref:SRPBCC family protein n=1 Tax=Nocardioides anomalus TaxID=2712223 RepID=UPI001E572B9A|nr:SRPBCC family protein [Nocardioides anomalus]
MAHRGGPPIYVSVDIAAPVDEVWRLTQDTDLHPRWDARFSAIEPVADLPGGGQRFRYELRLPGRVLAGTGTTLGEKWRPDGTRTSALRFTTPDRLSPLGDGRGYWRYEPTASGVRFTTGYDYRPGWGGLADRIVLRRAVGWLTAWSFDRLRIWAERGEEPERWPLRSVLWVWRPERPRAARCRRRAHDGRVMEAAPATLDGLAAP